MGMVMEEYQLLETEFSDWARVPHCVAAANGTAALHLALESLQLPLGSKVIVPEFTMVACARAVAMAGLVPVFVDCGNDLLLNVEKLPDALTPDTTVIMPVHIYGRLCNMRAITEFAKQHNLAIVEDCSEAHGAPLYGVPDARCWSFYKNKIVAGEEGGMISFREGEAAIRARKLRSLGFTEAHDFLHEPRGMNYRLSNANAALVRRNLARADHYLALRRIIEQEYDSLIPEEWHMPRRDVPWVYDLRLEGVDMAAVVRELNENNIAARLAFKPMSQQPEFFNREYLHTNAYKQSLQVIYLPIVPEMTLQQVRYNVTVLTRVVRANKNSPRETF